MTDLELLDAIEQKLIDSAPLSDVLRMLMLLGGRLESDGLRDWAKSQLDGYGPEDALPEVRSVGAPIYISGVVGFNRITGQHISAAMLPDFASKVMKDFIELRHSIPKLESTIANIKASAKEVMVLNVPNWEGIAREIDKAQEFQQTTSMYREVHITELEAIVADARNKTAELLGELRRNSRTGGSIVSGRKADAIVSDVVVSGDNNSVIVTSGTRQKVSARLDGGGAKGWWGAWGKAATVLAAILAGLALVVWLVSALSGATLPSP